MYYLKNKRDPFMFLHVHLVFSMREINEKCCISFKSFVTYIEQKFTDT